ncbi:ribonuclease p subunit p25 [Holotrichia oblita]|uniref:Ribonuclease p subunit p25 n=1 Tax=Holotrichia oblita TaxID=644536 RepID=A0ACB9T3D9_HOLOL|nr:ribonuclease p subunit p25 [Holotrichia oblita]
MENYQKGKNVEEPIVKENIPIKDLPEDFLWMQVRGGSKIRNLLSLAMEQFPEKQYIVWTGFGQSVGKAITCAEIMKREHKQSLHQITRICYRLVEEYWDPITPGLDQLVVKRQLPMIHILLSCNPLNNDDYGYQGPNTTIPYKPNEQRQRKFKSSEKRPKKHNPSKS